MPPNGGAGADLDVALAAAIPARDSNAHPGRGRVGQHLGQSGQALALCAGTAVRARQAGWRGVIEGGIKAQAGDAGHAVTADGGQELQGGKGAVGHNDQFAARQPAAGLQHKLPPPVRELLVPPPALLAVTLRGGQCRQERQRPDPVCPWDRGQEHEAEPAQAARLDEVPVAGPHGIAVDAFRRNALATPALDGVVNAQHDWPRRREGSNQQAEQQARGSPRAPGRAVQHAVVVHEPPLARQAGDTQDARHRALARGQDGAGQQHLSVAPTALKEQGRKG